MTSTQKKNRPTAEKPPPKKSRRTDAKKAPKRDLATIGWREWVALPDLGIDRIKAKVDTGANTASLHAYDVERFTEDGVEKVRFKVHPDQRSTEREIEAEALFMGQRKVRPSTGKASLRPVIETRLRIGDRLWRIQITLVRRDVMGFRMLLGRRSLRGKVLVDPQKSFLAGQPRTPGDEPAS